MDEDRSPQYRRLSNMLAKQGYEDEFVLNGNRILRISQDMEKYLDGAAIKNEGVEFKPFALSAYTHHPQRGDYVTCTFIISHKAGTGFAVTRLTAQKFNMDGREIKYFTRDVAPGEDIPHKDSINVLMEVDTPGKKPKR